MLRWLVLVVLLAGCATSPPMQSPSGPALSDFQGCHLVFPDGSPVMCRDERRALDAPDWRLGGCLREHRANGDWIAEVQWTLEGLYGFAANLQPGRQATVAVNVGGTQVLMHLGGSGQVAYEMQNFGRIEGLLIVYDEQMTFEQGNELKPVDVFWQSWRETPWPLYEVEGHWWQNNATIPGPFEVFHVPFTSFEVDGKDFTLNVTRNIWSMFGVGAGDNHVVTRPCMGPDSLVVMDAARSLEAGV